MKQVKPLPELHTPPLKAVSTVSSVYIAPAGKTVPAVSMSVVDCGSDPNMAFIYQHESGCRTDAIGPNGPCGLGQALPCSKLPCSLNDWSCQNFWFTNYAISKYGSTYAAYQWWLGHSWW